MEKIIREATRCKEIVQGLLEFSRHMPSKMVPLSINAILEETLSLVSDHLLFQNIDLIREFQDDLPAVLVRVNGEIVRRKEWDSRTVPDEAVIEAHHVVAGG